MTEVEKLEREKVKAVSVSFQRFILLKNSIPDAFFYFVEGKDAPYYTHRVRSIIHNKECVPIQCGNKAKTIQMHKLLSSNPSYDGYEKVFFVDKDFDFTLSLSSDIYVTPCYSIENLYCAEIVLSEILKCEFNILPGEQAYTDILQLFREKLLQFCEATLLFNAWYACVKKKSSTSKVSLAENFPKEFLDLNIVNINYSYDIDAIKAKYPDAPLITDNELEIKMGELKVNLEFNLRGKYQIQFFYEFIKFLINDANDTNRQVYINKKTKLNLDRAQILSQLSQYAMTPECLSQYIKNNIKN